MARKEEESVGFKGFNEFLHTRTGTVLLALVALAWVGNCYGRVVTDPNNFPDLEARFRVEKTIDTDGVYRLAVYRANSSSINLYDNDLVAFERVIKQNCGELAKFQSRDATYGPVNFRPIKNEIPWSCTWVR